MVSLYSLVREPGCARVYVARSHTDNLQTAAVCLSSDVIGSTFAGSDLLGFCDGNRGDKRTNTLPKLGSAVGFDRAGDSLLGQVCDESGKTGSFDANGVRVEGDLYFCVGAFRK